MPQSFKQRFHRLFIGKKTEYSTDEIADVPCAHCGEPSLHQWSACANGNRQVGVCGPCDVLLNHHALRFMNHPHADVLIRAYEEDVMRQVREAARG